MPYLSRNDLETLGARVFSDYGKLPKFRGEIIQRVEPETLAQELCHLNVEYYHLSKSGIVLGLTSSARVNIRVMDEDGHSLMYPLDGNTVLIERGLYEDDAQRGRYHFTLAHEVAHQILERSFPESGKYLAPRVHYSKLPDRPSYPITDWAEWQANTLASAILMPVTLVFNALCKVGLPEGIKTLNKVFFPDVYEQFCQAAALLEVSKQALALRLKRLGMLGQDYLDDPYRLVDVEV